MAIQIPEQYPLVIATATSTVFLNIYQYLNVNRHRKAAGIKYPQLYAEKAEMEKSLLARQFNCAQRAHQNTLESLPYVLLMGFVGGLKFPVVSSVILGGWILGRFQYTYMYSKGDPTKRSGMLSNYCLMGLIPPALVSAGMLVYETYF